jgi:2-keto-4-pentenoate hydratase
LAILIKDLGRIAERQLADYRRHDPGTIYDNPAFRPTLDEAYAIQLAVADLRILRGEKRAGFKVGCTGPNIREQFGMDGPISGSVWESEVHKCGARLASREFCRPAVEGEIAVRLGPDGEPVAAFPVIELHNFVFRTHPRQLQELVVNNGIHAGVVLPCTPEAAWPARLDVPIRVSINGRPIEEGPADGVPGGPRGSLDWLRAQLKRFDLKPFGLILTGTALTLVPIAPGDRVRVEADRLGYSEMTLS